MRPIRAPPQNRGTRIVNRGNVYLLQMYTYIHVGDILGHMRFMLFLFLFSDVRSGEFLPKRQHTLAARGFRSQHTLASTTNLPWPRELTFKGTPTHVGAPPPRVALANVHPLVVCWGARPTRCQPGALQIPTIRILFFLLGKERRARSWN